MLNATQMSKNRHGTSEISSVECDYDIKRVSYSQYLDEKVKHGGKKTQLCADNMTLLKEHLCMLGQVRCVAKKVHAVSAVQEACLL
jgi:hypothetical protein